jgi:transcriptional regulator with XRE-family HTH domain
MSELNWDFSAQIGTVLGSIRIARGLTQAELATLLSDELLKTVDADYIKRVEDNTEKISITRLGLFCYILQAKLSNVFKTAEELAEFECKSPGEQVRIIIEKIDNTLEGL